MGTSRKPTMLSRHSPHTYPAVTRAYMLFAPFRDRGSSLLHSQKYLFEVELDVRSFLFWKKNDVAVVAVFKKVRKHNKNTTGTVQRSFSIPAAYVRIIDQLTKESVHGKHNASHEALRRATYAEETLDALGKELFRHDTVCGPGFRSIVLNPILQRQMRGVPSHYTPLVRRAIAGGDRPVTIDRATRFYLEVDPIDPESIPSFRRNAVYIPEMRWHLAVLMGACSVRDIEAFRHFQYNQDDIMKQLQKEKPASGIPAFNMVELEVIHCEKIHTFFEDELRRAVGCSLVMPICAKPVVPIARPAQ